MNSFFINITLELNLKTDTETFFGTTIILDEFLEEFLS